MRPVKPLPISLKASSRISPTAMKSTDLAMLTKELGKAQTALWTAFQIAARAQDLDLAKSLRDQHKAMGAKIVEINGGPVVSVGELFR